MRLTVGVWQTSGGEYYAAGVGVGIAGFRADLAVIDDPVRAREDADSQPVRDRTWVLVQDRSPDAATTGWARGAHPDALARGRSRGAHSHCLPAEGRAGRSARPSTRRMAVGRRHRALAI